MTTTPSAVYTVPSGADDGYWYDNTLSASNPSGVRVGWDAATGTGRDSFVRFTGVWIPAGWVVTKALLRIKGTGYVQAYAQPYVHVSAERASDPTAPTSAGDANTRIRTAQRSDWSAEDVAGQAYYLDVTNAIYELRSQWDYANGRPMQFFLDTQGGLDDDYRYYSAEDAGNEPQLLLWYDAPVPCTIMRFGPSLGVDVRNAADGTLLGRMELYNLPNEVCISTGSAP